MEINVKRIVKETVNVKYVFADFGVRYFEDAYVNGNEDDAENPKIPCVKDGRWQIEVDIDEGRILNWTNGVTAEVHYKVCDDGTYKTYDENHNLLYEKDDYVPSIFSQDDEGYGDYVYLTIESDGKIKNWSVDEEMIEDLLSGGFGIEED